MTIEPITEDHPAVEMLISAVDDLCGMTIAESAAVIVLNAATPLICADLIAAHERRVTELLEANNREIERRRKAEARVATLEDMMRDGCASLDGIGEAIGDGLLSFFIISGILPWSVRARDLLVQSSAPCPACAPSAEPAAEGGEHG